ncbi:EthD family reductase [Jatrophihabitans sp.]|jgi:uncharacterized protein (TIGR02118 family)|uniref:EthD family reductase n=1 Tax=Jatrophihabitans sp. TaxID=1932789 RepID=UPI0030C74946|nr:EthD family reductase [Jatrophihabitans sp.]
MATLIAMYKHPEDPAAFDRHHFGVHVPLARKLPNLTSYDVSHGSIDGGSYYLVAVLTFSSHEAMTAALQSEAGEAAQQDLANFAGAGVDILTYDARPA